MKYLVKPTHSCSCKSLSREHKAVLCVHRRNPMTVREMSLDKQCLEYQNSERQCS